MIVDAAAPVAGLTLFLASFLGSWHCVGMCSAFCAQATQAPGGLGLYHLGRGLTYVLLGGVAGALGQGLMQKTPVWISIPVALSLMLLILTGLLFQLFPFSPRLQRLRLFFQRWAEKLPFRNLAFFFIRPRGGRAQALWTGMASVALPCGWLYSFALAAAATGQAFSGALVLFLFWLGTLPALSVVGLTVRQGLRAQPTASRRAWAHVLVALSGLYSLFSHFFL